MEFFELGKQCHICKVKDFLPFNCEFCKDNFCINHQNTEDHNCLKYKELSNEENNKKMNVKVQKLSSCSLKECNEASLVVCKKCDKKFCLDHRSLVDHSCVKATKKTINEILEENRVRKELEKKKKRRIGNKKSFKRIWRREGRNY
jgi:predicted nucleic acid binding AN1-type Zn finger protein